MSLEKQKLIDDLLTLSDKLFRKLLPTVPKDLLTLEVTMPQLKIMLILYINKSARMSEIASDLGVTLPTTTTLVDNLVRKNYVLRENKPGDRRVVICKLSEEGQKAIGNIWESARMRAKELLEEMDINKLRMFVEVLEYMMKSSNSSDNQ